MIIGQEKICTRIEKSTLDSFPRSLMLVGQRGGGKHLICNYIASKFNLTILDITDSLNVETIDEIYNRVEPYLYTIRINEISIKEQNTILKFLEEPLKNSFIVLIAETEMGLLPTIINRCQVWQLQNYTKEYLRTFVNNQDSYILDIAQTPGQIIELLNSPVDAMVELADKILSNIERASISNTLTLSDKFEFKNDLTTDKFNIHIFVDVLQGRVVSRVKSDPDKKYMTAYSLTSTLKKQLLTKNLDYKSLFERYLIELRASLRGVTV